MTVLVDQAEYKRLRDIEDAARDLMSLDEFWCTDGSLPGEYDTIMEALEVTKVKVV